MSFVLLRSSVEAPPRLIAETRVDFRAMAMEVLERSAESGKGQLCIDMTATEEVDGEHRLRLVGDRLLVLGSRPFGMAGHGYPSCILKFQCRNNMTFNLSESKII